MSSLPLSPEERAQKWGTVAKWAIFALAGFLFAPFAIMTITGMLGLIVAGAIAGITWIMLPSVEARAKNIRLRMIKAEAAKNPIETLEAEFLRRSTMLDERKKKIETFNAKTRTFGDKLEQFKRDYPADAGKFQTTYDQMRLLLKRQQQQWHEAEKNLQVFQGVVTRAKAMWAMALAANEAKAGSGLDEDSFYAQLKTETALESVTDGMNTAFAQLDTLVLESDNNEPIPVQAIPVTPTSLPAASPAMEVTETRQNRTAR